MKFIRKNGRVIPVRENGATEGSKKKYPSVKKAPGAAVAIGSAAGALVGRKVGAGSLFSVAAGALVRCV